MQLHDLFKTTVYYGLLNLHLEGVYFITSFQVKSLTELTVHVLLVTGKPILNTVILLVENLEKIYCLAFGPGRGSHGGRRLALSGDSTWIGKLTECQLL